MINGSEMNLTPKMLSEYIASWSSLSPQDYFAKMQDQMHHGNVNFDVQDLVSHGNVNPEQSAEGFTF